MVPPTVSQTVTGKYSATLKLNLSSIGIVGGSLGERSNVGFVYSTASNNPCLDNGATKAPYLTNAVQSTGQYSVDLIKLTKNTLYYFNSYAQNSATTP